MADQAVAEGLLRDVHRALLLADDDPVRLLNRLSDYSAPLVDKWGDPANR